MARRGRVRFDPNRDYYLILGVSHAATVDEIQSAFRRSAKKLHPDRNPDSEATAQFQRLSEAYAVLSDPASRAEYDTLRETSRPWFNKYDVPRRTNFATTPRRSGVRGLIAMLWNGPYRYVVVVLMVVVLLNIALALATNQNSNADANVSLTTAALSFGAFGPTPPAAPLYPDECSATDRFLSPVSNAVLPNSGFTVAVAAQGEYQLDWALLPQDTVAHPGSLQWQRLAGASASPPNRVLVDSARIANLIASLPGHSQLAFRLTVLSASDKPVQQCEITVWVE